MKFFKIAADKYTAMCPRITKSKNVRGRPFRAKPHSIAIRNWLLTRSPAPASLQLRSDPKKGRIYLTNIPEIGTFELDHGIKKNRDYTLSFRDEAAGNHINKIVEIRERGKKDAVSIYLKKEGKHYRYGKAVELTMRMVGAQASKWFGGKGEIPPKITARSDEQGRIYIVAKNRKSVIIKGGILPNRDYDLVFRAEADSFRGKNYINLCVDVSETKGTTASTYYFRYRGRFYYTARPKESAIRDAAPKRLTPLQKTHRRSRAIREYLEGRAKNPGSFPIVISKDGTATLTTLSGGQTIVLRGLGKGERAGRLALSEDSDGNISASVYENSGILNNRYAVKNHGQIIASPSGELGHKNKFLPEIKEIIEWLGLDQNGNLIKKPKARADLMHELDKAPSFEDSYQTAWWLHRTRLLAEKEVSLSYLTFELWQRGKIPRHRLKDFSFAGACLEIYLSLTQTHPLCQEHGSYLDLFQAITRFRQKQSLVTLTVALFIGGALRPRKKVSFLANLAKAYEYAQHYPWIQKSPDFKDNFGEALRFLAKNYKQDVPYRQLVLTLMVLNKFSADNSRIKIIALNYFLHLLPQLSQEIERLNSKSMPHKEKITAARAKFDRSLLTNKKGSPLAQEIQDIVLDLIFKSFAEDLLLNNDRQALEALMQQPSPREPQRSERDIYALAQKAPATGDALETTFWLHQRRIADYSLGNHMNYLLYCNKIPPERSMTFHMMAGAYDYFLSNLERIVPDIQRACAALSRKPYRTPFTLAHLIWKTRTYTWKKDSSNKSLSLQFTYLVVIAALNHCPEELKEVKELLSPSRKSALRITKDTVKCLEALRHPRINMDYYALEEHSGIPSMLLWRILNGKEKSTPSILSKLQSLLAEQLIKKHEG